MPASNRARERALALTRKDGFFKALMDNMQIGVIVSDHEGIIVYMNETYGRFLNLDPAEQIGKHATQVVANSRLHVVARSGNSEINYPHQFKDTGFLVHRVPVRQKGKIIAVLGLVLFDSASTASKLAAKVSFLEHKLDLYENELISLRSTRYTIQSIVGESSVIRALKRQASKAAATSLPVVITGESGTGKELFAQGLHHASPRRYYPFVRINCAAIPHDLIESELFGYERGAFTGAQSGGKPGKFELAHNGSIFLDEIAELPLDMQPKLLRVLEDKEFERVGSTRMIKADFRLIAATNQNLEEMIVQNRFREDLFYRLNVINIHIPPLRERREDILPLARHRLACIAQDSGLPEIGIAPQAEEALAGHDWPGNVRELYNVLERVVSYLERDTIYVSDLPFHLYRQPRVFSPKSRRAALKTVQQTAEKDALRQALERSDYNKTRAAQLLGIHRSALYKKIKKYRLPLQPDTRET